MPKITIETLIQAPREICFDLARDIDAHCETSAFSGETAVPPGKTEGLLEIGDTVTFRGRHLGVVQRFTAKITEFDRPSRFVDVQVHGAFKFLTHTHEFVTQGDATLMRDVITWKSPLGVLGAVADLLFVKRHMLWFVTKKQAALKALAEEHARAN